MAQNTEIPAWLQYGVDFVTGGVGTKIKNRNKVVDKGTCEARGGTWNEESDSCDLGDTRNASQTFVGEGL